MAHDLKQAFDLARNSGQPDAWILGKANILFGRIRLSRTEAAGCPPKSQRSPGGQAPKALRHNGSYGSGTKAAAF